jgi:hypothetical protein
VSSAKHPGAHLYVLCLQQEIALILMPHFVCPLLQEIAMMMVNKLSQISLNLKLPATSRSLSLSVAQQCMKEFQTKPSCDCAQENK